MPGGRRQLPRAHAHRRPGNAREGAGPHGYEKGPLPANARGQKGQAMRRVVVAEGASTNRGRPEETGRPASVALPAHALSCRLYHP